ncbi:hypothetical protein [Rhizobium rhizogenes]|uniref:hypothetical protein n=1 Tax=Rhizobium rhizogenes TaxID=359 RepID=UPI0004D57B04|nr:hypothetical protein [Rhizobium rhizogenes]KEA07467.1 hypothetical protein CN09_11180 [Rhizobium rhizogenes]NTJ22263.1 hypothetical protein [Rhizobium rhizogenes]QUE80981.1 hypothetical protein EML492_03995 [Rhizobium rhizogenes]TQO80914.1 hypothetical protein FFE80_07405 [Rhizobium rhizogenes]TRB51508.1 hypothetical protein EXN69_26290 [Rhizobium rhizogenes]
MWKFTTNLFFGTAFCGAVFLYFCAILYLSYKFGALIAGACNSDGFGFMAMIGFGVSALGGTIIALKEVSQ